MIKNIGVIDHKTELFEGQYPIPNGIRYNSYLIIDEDIAILDTVDKEYSEEWLNNLDKELNGKEPKYLVVHHVEPDHSGSIVKLLDKYPNICVVGNAKTFSMLENFYPITISNRKVVNNNDVLSLGKTSLQFVLAPMVHWPEVMVSYSKEEKALFSADAFGTFGSSFENWEEEASRYYFGIVGKYGLPASKLIQVAKTLDIEKIYSLHGPELLTNINYYLDLYEKWATYTPTKPGVLILCASVYGNTMKAANMLGDKLTELKVNNEVIDLNKVDLSYAVGKAFLYDKLVLASITYNGDVFPKMRDLINRLGERTYQNRTVAFIENGSWGIVSAKVMKGMLEGFKNITFIDEVLTIKSSIKDSDLPSIEALALKLK